MLPVSMHAVKDSLFNDYSFDRVFPPRLTVSSCSGGYYVRNSRHVGSITPEVVTSSSGNRYGVPVFFCCTWVNSHTHRLDSAYIPSCVSIYFWSKPIPISLALLPRPATNFFNFCFAISLPVGGALLSASS